MTDFFEPPRVLTEINRKGQAVIQCPFCRRKHYHEGLGHWTSHCPLPRPENPGYVIELPNTKDAK